MLVGFLSPATLPYTANWLPRAEPILKVQYAEPTAVVCVCVCVCVCDEYLPVNSTVSP